MGDSNNSRDVLPLSPEKSPVSGVAEASPNMDGNREAEATRQSLQAASELPEKFGRYRILRCLGKGGMGAVYLARDTLLDRQVALKVPRQDFMADPDVMERFLREAQAAANLRHQNLCAVYDVGTINGLHYLTMQYIEGRLLSSLVKKSQPLPPRQVAALVRKLALAMSKAHELGIIHRDLKPSNIMIDTNQEPVILDFGLARREKPRQDGERLTQSGAIVGTLAYMAPEQVRADAQQIGPSCDIYALGVVLYELLTGRLPFDGPPFAVLSSILVQDPLPPTQCRPEVDTNIEAICLRAMAKRPEDRFASMVDFAEELMRYLRTRKKTSRSVVDKDDHSGASDASPGRPTPAGPDTLARQLLAGLAGPVAPSAHQKWKRSQIVLIACVPTLFLLAMAGYTHRYLNRPIPRIQREKADAKPSLLPADPLADDQRFALKFDGKHSFARVPTFHYSGTKPITVEVIVTPHNLPDGMAMIVADASGTGFHMGMNDVGDWMFGVSNGSRWQIARSDLLLVLNRTYHVAGIYDGKTVRLFVDGLPQKQVIDSPKPYVPSNKPLILGAANGDNKPQRHYSGLIHAVRISSVARYAEAFTAPNSLPAEDGTLLALPLDEGTGALAADFGPHNLAAEVFGATWVPEKEIQKETAVNVPTRAAANDVALQFDGVKSRIAFPAFTYSGGPLTLEAFVTPTGPANGKRRAIISQEGGGDGVGLNLSQDGHWTMVVRGGRARMVSSLKPATINQRVHVAGVFDGKAAQLFVDGISQGPPVEVSYRRTGFNWTIGADPNHRGGFDNNFLGLIEQIRISNVTRYIQDFTPAEFLTADSGTLCVLPLDENIGAVAWDRSRHSNSGKISFANWVDLRKSATAKNYSR